MSSNVPFIILLYVKLAIKCQYIRYKDVSADFIKNYLGTNKVKIEEFFQNGKNKYQTEN